MTAKRRDYFGRSESLAKIFKSRFIKILWKFFWWIILLAVIIGGGLFFYYASQVPTREEFLASTEGVSTKIYDRTGEILLYDVSGDRKKSFVPLDQIPEHVRWALIALEDDQFYSHRGFDLPALVKVGLHEFLGIGPARGGSTITQQLVKNVLLSPEKTYTRKMKEFVLSFYLEKKFSKDEILELYFNVVPYGSTAYGVEAAAEIYFGKQTSELTLSEGAILAAILQATTYYSPYGSHVEELMSRQHFVLDRMAELGYISSDEAAAAKNAKLEFKRSAQSILAPHFIFYIKELLAEKYGEEVVEKGGLKVITTLDWNKQQIGEEAVRMGVESNEKNYGAHNAALAAIDPKTGEVLTMVGSRDYFNTEYDGAVNVVMRPRQPGSSFKPIVYAASFLKGLSPETVLFDVVTKFKTEIEGEYEPHNYDGKEHGPVTIRKALAGSLNIPAVKTIYLTGIESVLDLAEKMGYTTLAERSRFGLSLVLGGGEVRLIDHIRAFAVFAENGVRHNLQYILKVEDKSGKVLEEFKAEDNPGEEALLPEVAKQITSILSDDNARAYIFGVGSYLTLPGRPVATKTGTTNDYHDAWTIGYTPNLVTGVWVGNNDNTAMKGKADGSVIAAPIWQEFMKKALEGSPVENFSAPQELVLPEKPMLNGKMGAERIVQIDKATGKLATPLTPPSFIEEKIYGEAHNILHYVNRNNILGPIPENPSRDPQYENWEEAVQRWAKENNIFQLEENLPNEYDNLHTEENKPTLDILSPSDGTRYTSPNLNVSISVNTKRTINRVEYYLDNQLVATNTDWPFNLINYQMLGHGNGEKWLRVIAYDDIDNSREKSTRLNLNLASEFALPIVFLSPENGDQINVHELPLMVKVKINNYLIYEKIDFYANKIGEDSPVWVGYALINSSEALAELQNLQMGDYELSAILTKRGGTTEKVEGVRIRIANE